MDQNLDQELNRSNDDSHEEEEIEKPSYTYWKRESDKPFSNDFKPQKSEPVVNNPQSNVNTYGSAWNQAGTWEEKHLGKNQFEDFFNGAFKNKNLNFNDVFTIDRLSEYSGDTYYVFVRGKMKFVYDCEFTLNLRGLNDCKEVTGEIKIKEINNHDLDDDFEFDFSGKFNGDSDKADKVQAVARSNQAQIQKLIRNLFDELKESCLQKGTTQNLNQTSNLI